MTFFLKYDHFYTHSSLLFIYSFCINFVRQACYFSLKIDDNFFVIIFIVCGNFFGTVFVRVFFSRKAVANNNCRRNFNSVL